MHSDRWWNPAAENQATDRAFRIGQKKNVLVHKFLCQGTVEERIEALIDSKKSLSADVLAGSGEISLTEMKDEDVLYGVGARLDEQPELRFRLRAVDPGDLGAELDTAVPLSTTAPAAGKVLDTEDVFALFGLEMADDEGPVRSGGAAAPEPPPRVRRPRTGGKAPAPTTGGQPEKALAPEMGMPKTVKHPTAGSVVTTKPEINRRPRRRRRGAAWDPSDIHEASFSRVSGNRGMPERRRQKVP